ncbi:hypothetical protein H1C71_008896 [Ictidomys tridecemlineatus]|nr:hypothetical protein H1C71_008896 [Ictidomys tridecemlineatus]
MEQKRGPRATVSAQPGLKEVENRVQQGQRLQETCWGNKKAKFRGKRCDISLGKKQALNRPSEGNVISRVIFPLLPRRFSPPSPGQPSSFGTTLPYWLVGR